jgi:hypothetical protein
MTGLMSILTLRMLLIPILMRRMLLILKSLRLLPSAKIIRRKWLVRISIQLLRNLPSSNPCERCGRRWLFRFSKPL